MLIHVFNVIIQIVLIKVSLHSYHCCCRRRRRRHRSTPSLSFVIIIVVWEVFPVIYLNCCTLPYVSVRRTVHACISFYI